MFGATIVSPLVQNVESALRAQAVRAGTAENEVMANRSSFHSTMLVGAVTFSNVRCC